MIYKKNSFLPKPAVVLSSGSRVSNFNGNFTALYLAPKRIDDWKPRKEGFREDVETAENALRETSKDAVTS